MAIVRRNEPSPVMRRPHEWEPFETMRDMMRWDPFQEMAPHLWRGANEGVALAPTFDVRESRDAYIFKADLPGFREQDLDISVTGNRLTVSGSREAEQVEDSDMYYCCERSYGSFTRAFTLPEGVNADQVQADLKAGVLTIRIPKKAEAKHHRIQLRDGHDDDKKKTKDPGAQARSEAPRS